MGATRRAFLAAAGATVCGAVESGLAARWRKIAAETDGVVGAAAMRIGSGERVSLHGGERFPLASVCKLPIAMSVLALVAEGRLSIDQEIEIPLYDLVPSVSPIAERWAKEKRFRLDEMLRLMIAESDNTAVQNLFRLAGGANGIAARLRGWGVEGVRVDRDERTCGLEAAGVRQIPPVAEWTPGIAEALTAKIPEAERIAAMRRFLDDPRDTGTPDATVDLIRKLYRGEALPRDESRRMRSYLEATKTGPKRIKGLLPKDTVVGHKTGTTATAGSLNGGTNDVGAIVLPNGGEVAVAFYIKGSTRPVAARERVTAELARAAYDWAVKKGVSA